MNPSPVKGKTRRKPCTENPSARFDEEVEVERPLLYSTRALKHEKERTNKRISKMYVTALYPPGLKSHYAGLLLRKENGKCSTVKYCAEFPNIGNHSSKPQVNCKWP